MAHAVVARTSAEDERRAGSAARAVELARRAPEPMSLAYALTTLGDLRCTAGATDGVDTLREARSIVDRCPDAGLAGSNPARTEARHGIGGAAPAVADADETLTGRELAVLRFLATPLSQRDIASELFVSVNTVKSHCRAIYRKLDVGDRSAAVQAARRRGLL